MTGFQLVNGTLHADNVFLPDIAAKYGTPCYVYCASLIRQQYSTLTYTLRNALPAERQPRLYYAAKACSNIAILKLLKDLGCGLEIVSEGELQRGLMAGFKGGDIISTSFGKTEEEIATCLKSGIYQLNIESAPELDIINRIGQETNVKAPVVFRLNPDVAGGGHDKISTGRKSDKFGLPAEQIMNLYEKAVKMEHVEPLGLSVHIGSQVCTVESFKPAFEALARIVKDLRSKGHEVKRLDIGGGFPVAYQDEKLLDLKAYADWVKDIILPLETEIQMEPGRYLVADSGILLTKVIYIKERPEKTFLVLDAAMNDLIRPALYDSYHRISPVQHTDRAKVRYDIVGPVCESGDIFARDRNIPEMQRDELAVIEMAGAYGMGMASTYNSRMLAPEILVDGDHIGLIKKRQSFEDMIRGEKIPEWL